MIKYVSLAGNQVMAVLNPLLALAEQANAPEEIHILVTDFSEEKLKKAMERLRSAGMFRKSNISIKKISTSLSPGSDDAPNATELVGQIVSRSNHDDFIFFNLAGGLKFSMAACLYQLETLDHPAGANVIYLYPEMNLTHVFQMQNGNLHRHDTCPLPAPRNVLLLQDVPIRENKDGGLASYGIGRLILSALREGRIKLPDKYLTRINIRGMEFDLVWNSKNTMNFLKLVNRAEEARELIGLASDRKAFGELYHLNIAVLTCLEHVVEKIDREDRGRITTYPYVKNDMVSLGKALENAFSASRIVPSVDVRSDPMEIMTNKKVNNNETLVMVLGQEIMPSLIALWSHRPKTAVFLYTPDNQKILTSKDMLCRYQKLLPVEELRFHPIGFTGKDILELKPPQIGKPVVNISPGTKSQSAFLVFWALRHDGRIYSLHSSEGKLESIPDGESFNLSGPRPDIFMKFTGNRIRDKGENKSKLNKDRKIFEGIGRFIKMICVDKEIFSLFPRNDISYDGASFKRIPEGRGEIQFDSEDTIEFDLRQDIWCERLVGFWVGQCGAQDILVRMRTAWNPQSLAKLRERHGFVDHMADFDVIARKDCHYYLIECKSTVRKSVPKTAAKAYDAAGVLGRFVVPMICYLKYDGPPYRFKNGVYVFGYRTLLERDDIRDLLRRALGQWQTTNRRAY